MTDEELVRVCRELKRQVRGVMLDVCVEVLDRYEAKNLAPKPKAYRDMAKYMRDWRAKKRERATLDREIGEAALVLRKVEVGGLVTKEEKLAMLRGLPGVKKGPEEDDPNPFE